MAEIQPGTVLAGTKALTTAAAALRAADNIAAGSMPKLSLLIERYADD